MDPDIKNNNLIRPHLIGLNILGLVRFKDATFPCFDTLRRYFFFLYLLGFNITQYMYVYAYWGDLMRITTRGGTVVLYTSLVSKELSSMIYNKKFDAMIVQLHETLSKIETNGPDQLKEIVNEYAKKSKWIIRSLATMTSITIGMFYIYVIAIFFFLSGPGEPTEIFAVAVYLPFPLYEHPVIVTIYIITFICTICIVLITWNTFIVSLFMYAQCMLRVISYRIQNFRDLAQDKGDFEYLIQCIDDHENITRFVKGLAHIIRVPMNLDFLIIVFILCAELFLMTIMPMGLEMFITWGYIGTIFSIFFMYYWHANEIILEGTKVSDAAFESAWLDAEPRCKRAILLIIQRAQRPLIMRAGLHPMNLSTLLMVLRTTYSAFALLRQISETQ